jgi:uncharacterized delta-60 repeat protein
MRILISGSSGFIGFHLSKLLLKKSNIVHGIDSMNNYYDVNLKKARLKILMKYKGFSFSKINIENNEKLEKIFKKFKPKIVIHLAAQAGVRYSIDAPRVYLKSNIDGTFNVGTGFNATVWAITLQPDGKILVGGDFTSYSGSAVSKIVRLNTNGTIDTTFTDAGTINGTIYDIGVQPDNKVVIVGSFTSISAVTNNRIARFSSTGVIDNTFVTGGLNGFGAFVVLCQADGKVMVGGDFTTVSGVSSNRIVRLLSGGTIDATFNVGRGFTQTGGNVQILDIALTNGKYLVSGQFGSYNGTTAKALVRINSDGSIDTTLNQGSGFTYNVSGFSLPSITLSSGNIVVGGDFSAYDGVSTPAIAVLTPFGGLLNCE